MRLAMSGRGLELLVFALVGIPVLMILLRSGPRADAPSRPPRLSLLCGFGFLCALGAIAAAVAGAILAQIAAHSDITGFQKPYLRDMLLIAEFLRYGALLPALGALAFAMAGVGAVRESAGALRGRALGRSAVFVAVVVGLACLGNG